MFDQVLNTTLILVKHLQHVHKCGKQEVAKSHKFTRYFPNPVPQIALFFQVLYKNLNILTRKKTEAVVQRCSVKRCSSKFRKLYSRYYNFIKKETCEFLKNTSFYRTPLVAASILYTCQCHAIQLVSRNRWIIFHQYSLTLIIKITWLILQLFGVAY